VLRRALPRLAFADFYYLGGFRLPNTVAGDHFGLGGTVRAVPTLPGWTMSLLPVPHDWNRARYPRPAR
jgi:hypothetical protein